MRIVAPDAAGTSVLAERLELLVAPRVPRAPISDFVRELFAPAVDSLPLQRDEAAPVPCISDGRR